MLLSAATKRILLFKIRCASVQHSLSQPESFIVGPLLLILCISMYMYTHGIMGRRFPDGGLLRYRK